MIQFQVSDMTCGHCAATITKAVKAVDGAAEVEIDLTAHRVQVASHVDAALLQTAIREAGYSPERAK